MQGNQQSGGCGSMMARGRDHDSVSNSSIEEAEHFGKPKGSMCLRDGRHNWFPRARGGLLDGVEDDAVWANRDIARLSHRRVSGINRRGEINGKLTWTKWRHPWATRLMRVCKDTRPS